MVTDPQGVCLSEERLKRGDVLRAHEDPMQIRINEGRLFYAVVVCVAWAVVGCAEPHGPAVGLRDALAQEANRIRLLSEASTTVEFLPSTGSYWVALVPPGASSERVTRQVSLIPGDEERLTSCAGDATTSQVLVADRHGVECVPNEGVNVLAFQSVRKDKSEPVRIRLGRDAGGVHVISLR
jgi:hypothetical protein